MYSSVATYARQNWHAIRTGRGRDDAGGLRGHVAVDVRGGDLARAARLPAPAEVLAPGPPARAAAGVAAVVPGLDAGDSAGASLRWKFCVRTKRYRRFAAIRARGEIKTSRVIICWSNDVGREHRTMNGEGDGSKSKVGSGEELGAYIRPRAKFRGVPLVSILGDPVHAPKVPPEARKLQNVPRRGIIEFAQQSGQLACPCLFPSFHFLFLSLSLFLVRTFVVTAGRGRDDAGGRSRALAVDVGLGDRARAALVLAPAQVAAVAAPAGAAADVAAEVPVRGHHSGDAVAARRWRCSCRPGGGEGGHR